MSLTGKIRKLYAKLLARLPSTYPQAELIIYRSQKKMREAYGKIARVKGNIVDDFGAFCADDYTIHIPVSVGKKDSDTILYFILHEIGHLFYLSRFGKEDPRWDEDKLSEKLADEFSWRWRKQLKNEGFYK